MSDKAAVCDFLRRCVLYADASINRKRDREASESEIQRWAAYRDFTAYALSEVERGELDDWFASDGEAERRRSSFLGMPMEEMRNVEADALEHPERAAWLSALVAPRPVLLLSTTGEDGVHNLCPVTSVSVLSNTPPLLGISLSQDRAGRPRDTLVNIESGSRVSAMVLPGTWDAALLVNETAEPLAPERSEWWGLDAEPVKSPNDFPPHHPIAAAVLECEPAAMHALPEAVAKLVVLRVVNILRPDIGTKRQMPPDAETWRPLLAQMGLDRLTSGPDGTAWSFEVRSHRG